MIWMARPSWHGPRCVSIKGWEISCSLKPHWLLSKTLNAAEKNSPRILFWDHFYCLCQSIYYATRRGQRSNTSNLGNPGPHSSSELNFLEVKMWILTTYAKSMFISAAQEKLRREKKSEFLCKDFNFLTFQTFPNSRHRYQEIRIPFQRFELSCSQGPLTFPSSTL